jgi:hypothetical protein
LVRGETRAVRRWLQGYSRNLNGVGSRSEPLWRTQFAGENLPGGVIGFQDLLELRLVVAFVRQGVSLKTIRATVEFATQHFGASYPLTNKRFLTDGKRIFLEALEATGEARMIDVLRKQYVF